MSKYSGQDAYNLLCEARETLGASIERWRRFGIELAAADFAYRVAYTKEVTRLHDLETVAWTAAVEMARGDDVSVAELRYKRDVAQVQYNAEEQRINFLKLEVRILEGEVKSIQYGQ